MKLWGTFIMNLIDGKTLIFYSNKKFLNDFRLSLKSDHRQIFIQIYNYFY